ncbi:uncharacterized protein YALI1_E28504g [Yarrowia lipolytica]|uniref:Uncharacterized protein n=1 Tax=Yarrowia lipolytica TaxID=4952 RepID=A0A1D8NJS6_YARLL|nr:hypothetical protein YALI1_E28504g [Yarrowia lipolytica]
MGMFQSPDSVGANQPHHRGSEVAPIVSSALDCSLPTIIIRRVCRTHLGYYLAVLLRRGLTCETRAVSEIAAVTFHHHARFSPKIQPQTAAVDHCPIS